MAKSTYFSIKNRLNNPIDKDLEIKQIITSIYNNHKHRYGYRRIYQELKNKGYNISESKVRKLMRILELKGYCPKAKYKSFKGDIGQTCKNLLLEKEIDEINHKTTYTRNFKTTGLNQKWTTDVSEFRIPAGKVYLSPILDMNNGEIISYNISTSPNFKQTMDMLNSALNKFNDLTGLILHSDQGWQYRMEEFQQVLESKGILQSMSRKGNCYDNSPMENFFGIIKKEMFYGHEYEFKSIEHLINEIHKYIDYYNNIRIKSNLKGLSPSQYRQQFLYVI